MKILVSLCLALACACAAAQTGASDRWFVYLASYETGPGSVRVDLGLRERAPVSGFDHLVVTGTRYNTSHANGLPELADLHRLNALAEKVVRAIEALTPAIYAGTFTHNGEQLHYLYVKNPAGIEDALAAAYGDACSGCKSSTSLKADASWEAYLKFLYPNQAIVEHQPMRTDGMLCRNCFACPC